MGHVQQPPARRAAPGRPATAGALRSGGRRRLQRRQQLRRRRTVAALVVLAVAAATAALLGEGGPPPLTPFQARVVRLASSQVGYHTDPPDSYCNRFSAYWGAGSAAACPAGERAEEWCADFAAWVWRKAGAEFVYGYGPGQIDGAAASFYTWGVAHHRWHPAGSSYRPQPGDVAVYGLDPASMTAVHVAVVTGDTPGARGPDVVNGDGARTGFSVVERGTDEYKADIHDSGGRLAGYVSPLLPPRPVRPAGGRRR